jgi:hypothetical protein
MRCSSVARRPRGPTTADSFDHDHVLADLSERYLDVLEAVEATEG